MQRGKLRRALDRYQVRDMFEVVLAGIALASGAASVLFLASLRQAHRIDIAHGTHDVPDEDASPVTQSPPVSSPRPRLRWLIPR